MEKTRSGPFCANLAISPSPVLYAVLRGNGGRAGQRPRGKPGDRTLNDSKDETQPRERVFHVVVYRRRVSIVPSLRAGTRNAREGEPALVASIAAENGDGRVQRPPKRCTTTRKNVPRGCAPLSRVVRPLPPYRESKCSMRGPFFGAPTRPWSPIKRASSHNIPPAPRENSPALFSLLARAPPHHPSAPQQQKSNTYVTLLGMGRCAGKPLL